MAVAKGMVILLSIAVIILVIFVAANPFFSARTSPKFTVDTKQSSGTVSLYRVHNGTANVTKQPKTATAEPKAGAKPSGAAVKPKPTVAKPKPTVAKPQLQVRTETAPVNPGCIARKVSKYKPVDLGIEYHHPSVIQYAKLSKDEKTPTVSLTFMEYMALVSAYKFLKPERIIFHTYTNITGKYWEIIQKWNTSLVINRVERVKKLGKKVVPSHRITHQADFVKVRGLYQFGGVISDFDVIVVNGTRLKEMQKKAECVLSLEAELINAGFNSCIKNSSFVRGWLEGYYKDYVSTSWMHNASYRPKGILEDKKSDAVCYNMNVVGNLAINPNYANYKQWLKRNGVDWRRKVAAHYFNKDMKKYDETDLNADNSFGEMLRYVMKA